ncbi:hypothetical protein HID58_011875 [Brassica napus]|uniref:Defensin-like protein n=1 Tax=Brassica napus TaxID=3708 RepID=A0A816W7J4_BRANA|nr:hypothetical protein HID58_011875 [Brassica napus]CAF2129079.1 unnamed protein product [Brassica napus]
MAQAKFSVVLLIVFLIIFALVDDSMGCQASLGDCRICAVKCSAYGKGAEAHCDYRYDGGACICDFPCKEYKPPPGSPPKL